MPQSGVITEMTKDTATAIGREMAAVIQAKAQEMGLNVQFKGGTYDPVAGTLVDKWEVSIKPENDPEQERRTFERDVRSLCGTCAKTDPEDYSWVWLRPDDYLREITITGRKMLIVGARPRAKKWCVVIRDAQTGETKTTTEDAVRRLLNRPSRMTTPRGPGGAVVVEVPIT